MAIVVNGYNTNGKLLWGRANTSAASCREHFLSYLIQPTLLMALLLQPPIRCYDKPAASGLAPRTLTILLGTGTAADGGASPLGSARRFRDAAQRFRDEPS